MESKPTVNTTATVDGKSATDTNVVFTNKKEDSIQEVPKMEPNAHLPNSVIQGVWGNIKEPIIEYTSLNLIILYKLFLHCLMTGIVVGTATAAKYFLDKADFPPFVAELAHFAEYCWIIFALFIFATALIVKLYAAFFGGENK